MLSAKNDCNELDGFIVSIFLILEHIANELDLRDYFIKNFEEHEEHYKINNNEAEYPIEYGVSLSDRVKCCHYCYQK